MHVPDLVVAQCLGTNTKPARRIHLICALTEVLFGSCLWLLLIQSGNAQERTVHFTGTVVRDNQPVAGAELYALPRNSASQEETLEVVTVSGADGSFAFDTPEPERVRGMPGIIIIYAYHPDHSLGGYPFIGPTGNESLTIELFEPEIVSGRITDPDGTPVEGVTLEPYNFSFGRIDAFNGTTDAKGQFMLRNIPPDTPLTIYMDKVGYARRPVFNIIPGAVDLAIIMYPEGRIEGTVVYGTTGEPAVGVEVNAQSVDPDYEVAVADMPGWGEAVTDKQGRFVMDSLPANYYNVFVDSESMTSLELTAVAAESVLVEAGDTAQDITLTLVNGGIVSGRVTDRMTDEPIPNVGMGFYDTARPRSSGAMQAAYTVDNGEYRFRAAPGNVHVYVYSMPPEYLRSRDQTTEVDVEEGGEVTGMDFTFVKRPPVEFQGNVPFE